MRLHLVYPDWGYFPLIYRRYIQVMAPAIIAALTPSDVEIIFTDERLQRIDLDADYDLVAISMMTSQAARAYEIADAYRQRGIPVVLGGVHVSLMPKEASAHADAIVIGEAENTWTDVISDFTKGCLKKIYSCPRPAEGITHPRWSIFDRSVYLPMNSLQIARGCPVNCELCSVPQTFGTEFRMADAGSILDNIAKLDSYLFLINDNLHLAKRRIKVFYEGLSQTGKQWCGLAPLSIAEDSAYLDMLEMSNCWAMYVDLSPWISAGINNKIGAEQVDKAKMLIERIRERNIKVIASFVFGFDHDDKDVFERTVRFAKDNKIEESEFHILTPYPRTRLYERLSAEGRILTNDFSKYSSSSVVFRPARMTKDELYEGYIQAWREFYPADTHESGTQGLIIKTHACFPVKTEEFVDYDGCRWVDAVRKRQAEVIQ